MNGFNVEKIAECPDWLAEMVQPRQKRFVHTAANDENVESPHTQKVQEGSRNAVMFKQACRLRGTGMTFDAALDALHSVNKQQCPVPLADDELFVILKSAYSYSNGSNLSELTEFGNVNRMVSLFGDDLRYVPESDQFLYWNTYHWKPDQSMRIDRMLKTMVLTIKQEAKEIAAAGREDIADLVRKHASSSQSRSHINSVKGLLKSELLVNQSDFDSDDFLLGVKNGVVDLESGQRIKAERNQHITKQANVNFNARTECPSWLKFLDEIMCGDTEMVEYLQKIVGYLLTGDTREQAMFFFYGHGANGKSTFINVINQLMGDHAAALNSDVLMLRKGGNGSGATPDIAGLVGARLAIANELEEGSVLSEVLVKSITGGDPVSCRHLYGKPFSYTPKYKLVMIGNHKPNIRGTDHGIWRRIRFVEFGASFKGTQRDLNLEFKLLNELPGILNWAIEGCLKWQLEGLVSPEKVIKQTSDYQNEQDIIQNWIDERCDIKNRSGEDFEYLDKLFERYCDWAKSSKEWELRKRQFSQKLEEKGFVKARQKQGMIFRGISFKTMTVDTDGDSYYE